MNDKGSTTEKSLVLGSAQNRLLPPYFHPFRWPSRVDGGGQQQNCTDTAAADQATFQTALSVRQSGTFHNYAKDAIQLFITVQKLPLAIDKNADQVAVVVDVLRATSVIATALDQGAKEVIACVEIEDARRIAAGLSPNRLLCGERRCLPISGFDLGNSPRDYTRSVVQGRQLIMTTTNGTAALAAARGARQVLAAAFVNLSAVARYVSQERQVTIVCAGTDGQETDEDFLFAGALIARIAEWNQAVTLGSEAVEAVDAWQAFLDEGISLASKLSRSRGGRNLVQAGYLGDIDVCASVDSMTAVPVMVASDPITLMESRAMA